MKDEKAIRLLLWSIGGSGTHYNGPAISSFRLYRRAREQGLTVSLAHAYPEQPLYPAVFEEQFFLRHGLIAAASPVGRVLPSAVRGGANTVLFSRLARSWMKRYAQRFDVFHGLSGYTPTLALAEAAVAQGLPAVVAPVIYSELVAGNAVKAALGYLRHRVAILKRVQGVIAISSDIERRLLQLGIPERNVVRIPMGGVDVAEFRPLDSATSKME